MPYKGIDDEKQWNDWIWVPWLILVGIALADIFRPSTPEPRNVSAFGCYSTDLAAQILLDEKGMQILQQGFPRIGFHLEMGKTGIALTTEAPIAADPVAGSYTYSIGRNGIGWYLPFFRVLNDQRYGAFEESQLSKFIMLATDSVELFYSKSPIAACAKGVVPQQSDSLAVQPPLQKAN